jgi:hypothetical protein
MRGELSENAIAASQNEFVAILSPDAYREFEDLVLRWLDRNQETLELGGTGEIRQLASSVAEWLCLSRDTKEDLVEMREHTETGQQACFETLSQSRAIISQSQRLAQFREEIDRRLRTGLRSIAKLRNIDQSSQYLNFLMKLNIDCEYLHLDWVDREGGAYCVMQSLFHFGVCLQKLTNHRKCASVRVQIFEI